MLNRIFLIAKITAIIITAFLCIYSGAALFRFLSLQTEIRARIDEMKQITGSSAPENAALSASALFITPESLEKKNFIPGPTRFYDRHGRIIGITARPEKLILRSSADVPPLLIQSLLAVEDQYFYSHRGYRFKAIARAAARNIRSGKIREGGSTITQQLAKNIFTTRKRKFSRKIFELFCARAIESHLTKDEILTAYLNTIYFGHGVYGAAGIAPVYFNRNLKNLRVLEVSHLAAVIANPTRFSPFLNPEISKKRHRTVINILIREGIISEHFAHRQFDEYWSHQMRTSVKSGTGLIPLSYNASPYLCELIRRELSQLFERESDYMSGFDVHTTYDLEFQRIGEKILWEYLPTVSDRTNASGQVQGAICCVNNIDGSILSEIGGSGFDIHAQLIRSRQIRRQIGSLIKPFIYYQAFSVLGTHSNTLLSDTPLKMKVPGGSWQPGNYDNTFAGQITAEEAFLRSRNIPCIRLLSEIRLKIFKSFFSDIVPGMIKPERLPHNLTLALGTAECSPLETALLYRFFTVPHTAVADFSAVITRIVQGTDIIYRKPEIPRKTELINTHVSGTNSAAELIITLLEKNLRDERGTGYRAAKAVPPAFIRGGGKTGTTQDGRDAWFAGITPHVSCAVWIGYDDNRVMKESGGGRLAAPLWLRYMNEINSWLPQRDTFLIEKH